MKNKIKSVAEAFSMQPIYWEVKGESENFSRKDYKIKEIVLELVTVGNPDTGEAFWMYSAYNYDNKLIHQWHPKSVNVTYFP